MPDIHGRVIEAGGGEVRILVGRDTERYPAAGESCVIKTDDGCPVHGRASIDQVPAYDLNGIPEQAMEFCVACMDEGATPGGTWSRLLPTTAEVKRR